MPQSHQRSSYTPARPVAWVVALLCLAVLGWTADPLVRWQDAAPTVPKNAGSLTTNLVLSAAADTPVTVKWKTNTESAQAGTDFVNEANGTVHFARGEQTKSVTIAILDNPANPGGRTFGLQITNISGGGNWGNPNYIHVTISAASVVVVATPVISPPAGTYQEAVSASATCTTSGAVLRYRLDGADPTTDDPLLAAGLTIEQPCTLSVRGFLGGVASPVAKAAYAFQIANVTASLAGGTYTGPRSVTLSTTSPGAAIHYTLDGRTPTSASLVATGPIELPSSCTLRAIAMRDGWTSSASFRASYRLIVSTPNLAPSATFAGPTRVQASSNDPLATLRYSLTRANPTANSPQWPSEGLPISQTTTVRLGAFRNGWSNSAVVRSTYTMQVAVVVPSLPAGTYIGSRTVTLSTATPGAVIRYTLNGSTPNANSSIATGPITLPGSCTLRAQASLSGWTSSAVLRAAYVLAVPAPVLDPAAGAQPAWPLVTATADPLATVRYTLGATLPNSRSRAFPTGGLQLTGPTTVNVLATRSGWATSAVTSAAYTRNLPPAPNALSLIGDEEQSIATQATAVDTDTSALTWAVLTPPANGSITGLVASTGRFTYVPNPDFNGSDPFVLTVFDGQSTIPLTVDVTVRPVNDAPVLAGLESTLGWFRDGDSALALTTALTASDPDGGNLAGATIAITGNPQAGDSLVFADQNGITGQWNAGSATLTLSGPATIADYQAALHSVGFLSSDAHPSTAARTISLTVTDGALASNTLSRTIGVVTRSSPPWSEGFDGLIAGTDLHQLELSGGTRWHAWNANPGASTTVSATPARSGGTSIEIAGSADLVHEYKGVNAGGWRYTAWQYLPDGFTGKTYFILLNTYRDTQGNDGKNWSTQVWFEGGRVYSDYDNNQAALVTGRWVELRVDIDFATDRQRFFYDGVQLYEKSWTAGTTGGGALNLAAVDLYAGGASPVYYDDISLTCIAPSLSGAGTVAYVENAAPVPVMPAIAVDTFGVPQIDGAVVQLTGNLSQDRLSATAQNGITASWNAATGQLTLSGTATPADYQSVLASVAYDNNSDVPTVAPRTVTFTVTAPTGTSNSVSATVTVTPVNDAPVARALSLIGDEDTVLTGVAVASDVDGGVLTWSLASQPANGTATIDAITGILTYQPNAGYSGSDSFSLTVSDGNGGIDDSLVSVTVDEVDDPAVITVPGAGGATLGSDLLLTGFAVADIDSPTVSLTVGVDAGTISLPQLATSGVSASNSGLGVASVTLDGTPAAITTALAQVVWRAPETAGVAKLTVDGNGGHAEILLTANDAAAPIAVLELAATTWSSAPHGTTLLPVPGRFWNLDVAKGGRYHLWATGSGGVVQIEIGETPVGELALPDSTNWTCHSSTGAVQTLGLADGPCRLSVRGDGNITSLTLVAETPAGIAHPDPVLVGPGTVAVIDAFAFDHSIPAADGWSWLPGSASMVAQPDTDLATHSPNTSTRLDYDLYVTAPGTYRLWVKGMGNLTGDSVWLGLDGTRQANYLTRFDPATPVWSTQLDTGTPNDLVITSAGHHVLNLWMREDGVSVSQLAVSMVSGWAPIPTVTIAAQVRQGPLAPSTTTGGFAFTAQSAAQILPGKFGTTWTTPTSGPGLQALPDVGAYSNFATAPAMTWWLNITTPGTWQIWLRAAGPDTLGDTIFASLDGTQIDQLGYVGIGPTLPLLWTNRNQTGRTVTFTVAPGNVGLHAFTLWMREDGYVLERASLQDSNQPIPTGEGPALSAPSALPVAGGDG